MIRQLSLPPNPVCKTSKVQRQSHRTSTLVALKKMTTKDKERAMASKSPVLLPHSPVIFLLLFIRTNPLTLFNDSGGYLSGEGLSGLETSARDALTRVMNSPDVQNLGEGLRNAGIKVILVVFPRILPVLIPLFQLSDYLAQFNTER